MIKSKNEYSILINRHNNVIFYFYSSNINNYENLLENIDDFFKNINIKIIKIDVDQNPDLIFQLDITTYPFFRVIKNKIYLKDLYKFDELKDYFREQGSS